MIDVSSSGRGGEALITLRITTGGRRLQIGRLRLRKLRSGHVRFVVGLDQAAAARLRKSSHLDITVTIALSGSNAKPVSVVRHVVLHT
jgi:hypothetical protein